MHLQELLNELDQIWDTYTINCNGVKHLIPVNDYDLDVDKVNEWISLQKPYYQKISTILFKKMVEHVSYETFLEKSLQCLGKLEFSILNKIKILHSNQKVLLLLNLIPPKYHKSESWVFSLMYSGGEALDDITPNTFCFKNILNKLYKLYPNKIVIKILYDDKIKEIVNEILNDSTDYIILDCKFDDCCYSGSQLYSRILRQSNIIFDLLKNNHNYTIKNPDINDNNGIFFFDYKTDLKDPIKNYYSFFLKNQNSLIDSYSNNNHLYFLKKLNLDRKYSYIDQSYLGESLISLYKNNYKEIEHSIPLLDRLKIVNDIINLSRYSKNFYKKKIYDPNNLDNNFLDLYKQIKGINYNICICIPYITNTAIEQLDKLIEDNPFYYLEKMHVQTPKNIETQIQEYNNFNQEFQPLCLADISNIFYGNDTQHQLICDKYQLSKKIKFRDIEEDDLCNYLFYINQYKESINKRCFIYFDHKMATFNSSFPMTLLLGNIWFPNQGLPFFYGSLIRNPASFIYNDREIKKLLSSFGDEKQTNYFFFDRYIIPPYKLKTQEEIRNYLKYYDKCNTLSYPICNCLPKCKIKNDKCLKKTFWDYTRDYISDYSTIT